MTISRTLDAGKPIHVGALDAQLRDASIPIETVALLTGNNLRIDYTDASTAQQRGADTDAVIALHSAVGPLKTWGQLHLDRALILARAAKLLDDGINGHTVAGANDTTRTTALRACIGNSVAMLRTDAVTDTHLDKLVDLMAFPAPASATLAQCRNMFVALQAFIAIHGAMAGIAAAALE